MTVLLYIAAAVAEIAGCFAFWQWWRGASAWWLVPGTGALAAFAFFLALTPPEQAGRSFAVYAGIYLVGSLAWMWGVEGARPDRWDVIGGMIVLAGAAVILWAPRT